ncbi:hypothetical protein JJ691_53530 [Kutzneria sp. CA-103260]|nr:hypothetical protein JJ691_53530 [Kutzneria sp. CA-103260]
MLNVSRVGEFRTPVGAPLLICENVPEVDMFDFR